MLTVLGAVPCLQSHTRSFQLYSKYITSFNTSSMALAPVIRLSKFLILVVGSIDSLTFNEVGKKYLYTIKYSKKITLLLVFVAGLINKQKHKLINMYLFYTIKMLIKLNKLAKRSKRLETKYLRLFFFF